jgi:hypothetical protein
MVVNCSNPKSNRIMLGMKATSKQIARLAEIAREAEALLTADVLADIADADRSKLVNAFDRASERLTAWPPR